MASLTFGLFIGRFVGLNGDRLERQTWRWGPGGGCSEMRCTLWIKRWVWTSSRYQITKKLADTVLSISSTACSVPPRQLQPAGGRLLAVGTEKSTQIICHIVLRLT